MWLILTILGLTSCLSMSGLAFAKLYWSGGVGNVFGCLVRGERRLKTKSSLHDFSDKLMKVKILGKIFVLFKYIYIYIYIHYISPVYSVILPIYPSPRLFDIAGIQATRRGGSNAIPSSQSRSTFALRPSRVVMRKHFCVARFGKMPHKTLIDLRSDSFFRHFSVFFVSKNDAWWFVGMFADLELIQLFKFMKLPVVLKVKQVWLWNTTWIS